MNINLLKAGIFSWLFMLTSLCYAQGSNFQITNAYDTLNYQYPCDSSLSIAMAPLGFPMSTNANVGIYIDGTNFSAGPINATINWGDGTSSNYTGQMAQQGQEITWNQYPFHLYPNNPSINYTVIVTVTNPSNQSSATTGFVYHTVACGGADFYGYVSLDCDGDNQVDSTMSSNVPFNLLSNGTVQYSLVLQNNMAQLNSFTNGTYQLQLDPAWLTANGWHVTSMQQQTIQLYPGANITFQMMLACDSVPTGNNTACVHGSVFCDENGNGVQDSMEMGINNAPINVQYNNQSYNGVTNGGYYYISFPNGGSGAANITVNAQWLAQNGYYLVNNSATTNDTDCDSNVSNPVNFAVNCDSAQTQNECVYGVAFCDGNNNGILDSGEMTLNYAPIHITGNANSSVYVYTNAQGYFYYSGTQLGSTTATVQVSPYWLQQHGYSSNGNMVTVSTNCNNTNMVYLGIDCNTTSSGCSDLWSQVQPWIGYYQNQNNYIKLKWGSYGPAAPGSYELTLTFPSGVTPNTSSIDYPNYVITGNTITWTFTSANMSNFMNSDIITFWVPASFPSGTQHYYTSSITATGSNQDCHAANNDGSLMMILGNSYDPNDKTVDKPMYISPAVQDELTYVIRFQNTGDAPAQNIYILDTLSANLDLGTFELIETSHDMQVIDLGGGVYRFDFPGIWLPDSTSNEAESHGHLTYRIKENANNTLGSSISNTAYIYFDWNAPIVTNTTYNENNTLGVSKTELVQVQMFPNPVKEVLHLQAEQSIVQLVLTDLSGKVIKLAEGENIKSIDLQGMAPGVYLVSVQTATGGKHTQKITKQ